MDTKPPLATQPSSEMQALTEFLDIMRWEFQYKCGGLSQEQMAVTLPPSDLNLGGLVKHMTLVEDAWFSYRLAGNERREPWKSADWDADPDWEIHSAKDDTPEELFANWDETCDRSRAITAESDLERITVHSHPGRDELWNVRWILVHMIEEYARHLGHADLIRESIDGQKGDDGD
ncbi:MAG: DinB family protein [Acidimicrobiales bacterium]|nr:DinB family protein [Acidimicrobiales bacterium]RZV44941.1 MAG: DinB family protein [Acidimicrobiales bacterium]